jgi:hypothetical protein
MVLEQNFEVAVVEPLLACMVLDQLTEAEGKIVDIKFGYS